MAQNKRLTIGDFNIGKIGIQYFVYRDQWFKYLSKSDANKGVSFDDVIKEAYDIVCEYCKTLKLPNPPKPKLEL